MGDGLLCGCRPTGARSRPTKNGSMSEPSRDPNEAAADLLRKATGEDEPLPPDLEKAWEAWIRSIQNVDERARTLLRAAFEAGVEAGSKKS